MAPITIRYRVAPNDPTPKPFLRVWFEGKPPIRVAALVDSGADRSAIPLHLAIAVGVTYDPAKPTLSQGAGGKFEQFEATSEVLLQSEIGPIKLDRPTLNGHIPLILLGRNDFFASYRVKFDQRAGLMEIEPYGAVAKQSKRQKKRRK